MENILGRSHRGREWEVGEMTFLLRLGNFNWWACLTCAVFPEPRQSPPTSFLGHRFLCVCAGAWVCVLFSHQVVSDSSRPRGLQHARLLYPSPSPRVCPSSCPLNRWCHLTASSSVSLSSWSVCRVGKMYSVPPPPVWMHSFPINAVMFFLRLTCQRVLPVVSWLRARTSSAGRPSSIPGWGIGSTMLELRPSEAEY